VDRPLLFGPNSVAHLRPSFVRQSQGFTLVEVLIVVVITASAVIALAQVVVLTMASNRRGRDISAATLFATAKMEELRMDDWGDAQLTESPGGTLDSDISGYVDYLDASGVTITMSAGQTEAPPGTVFVRRWAIRTVANAQNTVLLQVVIVRQADARSVVLAQLTSARTKGAM